MGHSKHSFGVTEPTWWKTSPASTARIASFGWLGLRTAQTRSIKTGSPRKRALSNFGCLPFGAPVKIRRRAHDTRQPISDWWCNKSARRALLSEAQVRILSRPINLSGDGPDQFWAGGVIEHSGHCPRKSELKPHPVHL